MKKALTVKFGYLLWGFAVIASFGSIVKHSKKSAHKINSLIGTRGLWNDFANFGISSAKAMKKSNDLT